MKKILILFLLINVLWFSCEILPPEVYNVKDNKIYYGGKFYNDIEIQNINVNNYEIFSEDGVEKYIKDDKNVYFRGNKIEEADSETFLMLDGLNGSNMISILGIGSINSSEYSKDKNHVYYNGDKIEGSDSKTFEVLKNREYSKDKNYVYFQGNITEYDSKTFYLLDYDYSKDKNYVYYKGEKIENSNPETFEILEDGKYSKDKNYIYRNNEKLDIDVETYEMLEGFYIKDKNSVYYDGKKINDIDIETFEVLNEYYAKDKNHVYNGVNKIFLDTSTFEILSYDYIKDKNGIYYEEIWKPKMEIGENKLHYLNDEKNFGAYNNKIISRENVNNYRLEGDYLVVKDNVFKEGKLTEYDGKSFEFLEKEIDEREDYGIAWCNKFKYAIINELIKDKNGTYLNNKKIDNLSKVSSEKNIYIDNNGEYYQLKRSMIRKIDINENNK